jgi:formylmethanofuran dehydrogenase subunit A
MIADIAIYDDTRARAAMFRAARAVYKEGRRVVRDGAVLALSYGRAQRLTPGADRAIAHRLDLYYDEHFGLPRALFGVPDWAIFRDEPFRTVPCLP